MSENMAPRTDRPRAAFDPVRPHRRGVFHALTDRDTATDTRWRSIDAPTMLRNFDTYRNDEVSLNIHLTKRDRGSGSWVGFYASRGLAVPDPAEAWERLSGLGYCPAPGDAAQRAFATDCEACDGLGTVRAASGLRRACEGCAVARIGSRRRGCGYTIADAPRGYGAINAVAHWAMLGTPTILAAEELARETFARAMPAGREALRTVAWLPVVPRTWEPIAHRRSGTSFAEEAEFRALLFASIADSVPLFLARGTEAYSKARVLLAARSADRRSFDRVQNRRALAHLRALDNRWIDPLQPRATAPARELLDLGLAPHDIDGDASVVVIAFPVQ